MCSGSSADGSDGYCVDKSSLQLSIPEAVHFSVILPTYPRVRGLKRRVGLKSLEKLQLRSRVNRLIYKVIGITTLLMATNCARPAVNRLTEAGAG
jgi:hypothetical protein